MQKIAILAKIGPFWGPPRGTPLGPPILGRFRARIPRIHEKSIISLKKVKKCQKYDIFPKFRQKVGKIRDFPRFPAVTGGKTLGEGLPSGPRWQLVLQAADPPDQGSAPGPEPGNPNRGVPWRKPSASLDAVGVRALSASFWDLGLGLGRRPPPPPLSAARPRNGSGQGPRTRDQTNLNKKHPKSSSTFIRGGEGENSRFLLAPPPHLNPPQ